MKSIPKNGIGTNNPAKKTRARFPDPAVAVVFKAYPKPLRARLLALRRLIFDTAGSTSTKGVGALQKT
jgi:hypothetical protein